MLVATDAAFCLREQSQRTVRGMHQGARARGCGAWLTSRTASARRLTCTCTPSGPPAARLQRRCSYRPHGPPGEASGFVATECVRNPVNSVNWGFLQACATDLENDADFVATRTSEPSSPCGRPRGSASYSSHSSSPAAVVSARAVCTRPQCSGPLFMPSSAPARRREPLATADRFLPCVCVAQLELSTILDNSSYPHILIFTYPTP